MSAHPAAAGDAAQARRIILDLIANRINENQLVIKAIDAEGALRKAGLQQHLIATLLTLEGERIVEPEPYERRKEFVGKSGRKLPFVLVRNTPLAYRILPAALVATSPLQDPVTAAEKKGAGTAPPTPDDLPPRAKLAYEQYLQAVSGVANEDNVPAADVTDKRAYEYLKDANCNLASLDTWSRNLRTARKALGLQKHKPKNAGPAKYDGRSAVPRSHFGE